MTADPRVVSGLTGVYDADGGLAGEARYVVGHLLGRAECALCDITHGPLRRKREFDALRGRLGVPFPVVHRNERNPTIAALTGHALPCVVAATAAGPVVVMGREALEECGGDVGRFEHALRTALTDRGLVLADES
jgi:hypothetical protein